MSLARPGLMVLGPSAKTTPRYDAPAPAADAASCGRMMPQILILAVTPRNPGQLTKKAFRRSGLGEGGPYQNSVSARLGHPKYILFPAEPAFSHRDPIPGYRPDDPPCRRGIDLEGVQIPAVDPNDAGSRRQRGVQLRQVVNLYQRIQTGLR